MSDLAPFASATIRDKVVVLIEIQREGIHQLRSERVASLAPFLIQIEALSMLKDRFLNREMEIDYAGEVIQEIKLSSRTEWNANARI